MALIRCRSCRHEVCRRAERCPNCGDPRFAGLPLWARVLGLGLLTVPALAVLAGGPTHARALAWTWVAEPGPALARVRVTTGAVPRPLAVRATATRVWRETGSQRVEVLLPGMDAAGPPYAVAEFGADGLESFAVDEASLGR